MPIHRGDSDKKDQHKEKGRVYEALDAETAPSFYTNSLQLKTSPWDFQLYFGEIVEATPERFAARVAAKIIMSPQHAKAVVRVLQRNIEEYEADVGVIPAPSQD